MFGLSLMGQIQQSQSEGLCQPEIEAAVTLSPRFLLFNSLLPNEVLTGIYSRLQAPLPIVFPQNVGSTQVLVQTRFLLQGTTLNLLGDPFGVPGAQFERVL